MGKSSTEEARLTAEILNNPKFQKMARQKSLLGWSFSAVMFSVYTAFIWIIGTRPDCMPQPLLDYLEQLSKRTFLLVEYGVESTCDRSLERIQRGHSYQTSVETIERTHAAGILVGAHLILGLPGESREEMLQHADRLSQLPITTLKIHQLQIIRGTIMAGEYQRDPSDFHLFTEEEYIDLIVDFVHRLRPDIVLERFVSQSPPALLLAPRWGWKNHEFTAKIRKALTATLQDSPK